MANWPTSSRNAPETAWVAVCPQGPQQQVIMRPDEAYKRLFSKARGFPKFKKYGDAPGLRFPDPAQLELDTANGRIKLQKLGWVRMRQSRIAEGAMRNVTVTREGAGSHARWFASIQTRSGHTAAAVDVEPTLGIDLGLTCFAATSAGEMVELLKALTKQQQRLKHAQRSVSRKIKGSANRRKAVGRLGVIHRRIAHQRATGSAS